MRYNDTTTLGFLRPFQKNLSFNSYVCNFDLLQQVATPTVVKKILRMKQEQPTMFAWEIREQLARQGACDPQSLPSVSSVNRILRGGGLHTDHTGIEGGSASTYASQVSSNVANRGENYRQIPDK